MTLQLILYIISCALLVAGITWLFVDVYRHPLKYGPDIMPPYMTKKKRFPK